MARFRKRARRSRGIFGKVRRSFGSKGGAGNSLAIIGGAMAYGAVREKISNALIPVTSAIPLGNYADEALLGLLSWGTYKYVKNPLISKIALGGLVVESARIGEGIANGSLMAGMTKSSSSSSSEYTYG